ncbi:hypothetical protein [Streptomyces sp. PsTaAH-124]|nr:hypothetical protein [Streptomyces sp. PsTaAH-124]
MNDLTAPADQRSIDRPLLHEVPVTAMTKSAVRPGKSCPVMTARRAAALD